MAKKEANFDLYIHDLLVEAGIQADTQGSNIIEINNALKSASKHKTGNVGFPEYCAVVNDFVLVMEDNSNMNRFSGLFIARMLRQTCSKYSYGKMGNKESIKREKVMLPINDNGKPDYLFMEQYIKYIILKLKTKYLKEK